ncbi:MAG: TIGR04255 family protein [Streptosporangiaceae bacterium]
MEEREIYPNPPIVLVAVEARHPDAPLLSPGEQSEMKRLLASAFPLPQPLRNTRLQATPGAPTTIENEVVPRFATRDQTTAVTFGAQSVVLETTKHQTFEHLSALVRVSVEARQKVAPVDGLMRLGLRYVDEVRVPDICDGATGWAEWVDASLLGPATVGAQLGLVPEQWQGATVFGRGGGRQVTVQYGPREGFAVMPGGALQRSTPPPGAFFLLDIDSYWVATGEVPEFTAEAIVELCSDLHEPVSRLFESLITDRLRTEVLRHA